MLLHKYGLNSYFIDQLKKHNDINNLGRVVLVSKNSYKIITNSGLITANLKTANLHYRLNQNLLPQIGDFVTLVNTKDNLNINNTYLIDYILKPFSSLKRKIAGKKTSSQIIANNIDYAFITIALDDQFNLNKANRMVISCIDGNIIPIIILTKTDLSTANNSKITEAINFFTPSNLKIINTSIKDDSYKQIFEYINNKTAVFIGSSGSGKSSLINLLLNSNIQATSNVSNTKHQGVHTTTNRQMFVVSNHINTGIVIDTPGMREFAIALNKEDSLENNFIEILQYTKLCKFSNCNHVSDMGCGVLSALENGKINADRYKEYIKLTLQIQKAKQLEKTNKLKDKSFYNKLNKSIINNKYKFQINKNNQD